MNDDTHEARARGGDIRALSCVFFSSFLYYVLAGWEMVDKKRVRALVVIHLSTSFHGDFNGLG